MISTDKAMGHPCQLMVFDIRDSSQIRESIIPSLKYNRSKACDLDFFWFLSQEVTNLLCRFPSPPIKSRLRFGVRSMKLFSRDTIMATCASGISRYIEFFCSNRQQYCYRNCCLWSIMDIFKWRLGIWCEESRHTTDRSTTFRRISNKRWSSRLPKTTKPR